MDESGAVVIACEQPVAHASLKYAGTPDLVLSWRNRIVVPDIKATAVVPRTVGIQTAAYAHAWHSMHGNGMPQRYCIHLTRDQYRAHRRDDPSDWALFQSCLNIHRYKEQERVAA
jgi:hypothetical protein